MLYFTMLTDNLGRELTFRLLAPENESNQTKAKKRKTKMSALMLAQMMIKMKKMEKKYRKFVQSFCHKPKATDQWSTRRTMSGQSNETVKYQIEQTEEKDACYTHVISNSERI